jgi:hypothetical protein
VLLWMLVGLWLVGGSTIEDMEGAGGRPWSKEGRSNNTCLYLWKKYNYWCCQGRRHWHWRKGGRSNNMCWFIVLVNLSWQAIQEGCFCSLKCLIDGRSYFVSSAPYHMLVDRDNPSLLCQHTNRSATHSMAYTPRGCCCCRSCHWFLIGDE